MKEGILRSEEVFFLGQLADSLEDAFNELKVAYEKKDSESLSKIKNFILEIQKKISEVLR